MKTFLFALPVVLGVYVLVMAFVRGSHVEIPAEVKRRIVTYRSDGFELRLDGLAVSDPLDRVPLGARVKPRLTSTGVPEGILSIEGDKLTQGSVLLLRVGQPIARYREAFPARPYQAGAWRVQPDLLLEVEGQSLIEKIRLESAPVVILNPMRPVDSYYPGY